MYVTYMENENLHYTYLINFDIFHYSHNPHRELILVICLSGYTTCYMLYYSFGMVYLIRRKIIVLYEQFLYTLYDMQSAKCHLPI